MKPFAKFILKVHPDPDTLTSKTIDRGFVNCEKKKSKCIRFTFNGGRCITMKYSDYLKNKGYWDNQLAIKEIFFD